MEILIQVGPDFVCVCVCVCVCVSVCLFVCVALPHPAFGKEAWDTISHA